MSFCSGCGEFLDYENCPGWRAHWEEHKKICIPLQRLIKSLDAVLGSQEPDEQKKKTED